VPLDMQVNHGKLHFQSLHGKIGLGATIAAPTAALGGALSFRKLGLLTHVSPTVQARVKALHRASGPVVLAAAFVNVFIGLGLKGAGPRDTLHTYQRAALITLGVAEAYMLWGPAVAQRLGLTRCGKSV
jgi:Eukaryotic cytochrome b561